MQMFAPLYGVPGRRGWSAGPSPPKARIPISRRLNRPCGQHELHWNACPQSPFRSFRESIRMAQHVEMHIHINRQHGNDAHCGHTACCRNQQPEAAGDLCDPRQFDPRLWMRVVVRHDVHIEVLMPEVIDASGDVDQGLQNQALPGNAHACTMRESRMDCRSGTSAVEIP